MQRKNKYNNKKICCYGKTFDSKREYERYVYLRMLQASDQISELKTQVAYALEWRCKCGLVIPIKYASARQAKYIADFTYVKNDKLIIEDVKSKITKINPFYKLKKAIMSSMGYQINEV